jgi:hypothetical protein
MHVFIVFEFQGGILIMLMMRMRIRIVRMRMRMMNVMMRASNNIKE